MVMKGSPAVTENRQRVSVIIVTFNAAAHLQNCLDSIYRQTYADIEIVIIDGKSTDGTIGIIESNAGKIHFWLSEQDEGIYDAMNKGVKRATGDWLYFLGADDELLPGFSAMVAELKDPSAIYYGNVFAEGAKRNGFLSKYRFAKIGLYHQAMIFPKAVFKKYKYDTRYKISADYALTLKLYGDKNFHFVYIDHTLANFNHEGISGISIDAPFQKAKPLMVLKYFGPVIWARYIVFRLKHQDNPRR